MHATSVHSLVNCVPNTFHPSRHSSIEWHRRQNCTAGGMAPPTSIRVSAIYDEKCSGTRFTREYARNRPKCIAWMLQHGWRGERQYSSRSAHPCHSSAGSDCIRQRTGDDIAAKNVPVIAHFRFELNIFHRWCIKFSPHSQVNQTSKMLEPAQENGVAPATNTSRERQVRDLVLVL